MIVYPYSALKSHIAGGKLLPLATLGATRAPWMPNVPTMVESGYPDLEFVSWFAIYGPPNLPAAIAERVSAAYCQALADPQLSASLVAEGSEPACSTPTVLGQFTNTELERTQQVVKRSRVTFEE